MQLNVNTINMDKLMELDMMKVLDNHDARNMARLADLIDRSVRTALITAGVAKSHITKSEACQRYGRTAIDRWIANGDLRCVSDGNGSVRTRISVVDLERVAARMNNPAIDRSEKRRRGRPSKITLVM